jgi:hypothetical protein
MRRHATGRTVTAVRFLLIGVLLLLAVGLTGWGVVVRRITDREGAVQRSRPASHADVEKFARFVFPPSATAVKIDDHAGIDRSVRVLFRMDRADVDAFVASTGLDAQRTGNTLRARQGLDTSGSVRQMLVVLHPDIAIAEIVATEL